MGRERERGVSRASDRGVWMGKREKCEWGERERERGV